MAEKDMFATTQLVPLLAERGVRLSREQVYGWSRRPGTAEPGYSAALCDILGCEPGDLIEVGAVPAAVKPPPAAAAPNGPGRSGPG